MTDAGLVKIKQVEIDFGTGQYIYESTFTITDLDVVTTSNIICSKSHKSPSDGRNPDEIAVEQLELSTKSGTGSFDLHVNSIVGPTNGKFIINYMVTT